MAFYTYLVANHRNGTIYVGMTDDIARRALEHKMRERRGFSATYGCDKLVWYEAHPSREDAFQRERQIKEWRRNWKLMLIESDNPDWIDLYPMPKA
jgi:putative endonuclease